MDPQAALDNLVDLLTDRSADADDVREQARALSGWLKMGGFAPTVDDAARAILRGSSRTSVRQVARMLGL